MSQVIILFLSLSLPLSFSLSLSISLLHPYIHRTAMSRLQDLPGDKAAPESLFEHMLEQSLEEAWAADEGDQEEEDSVTPAVSTSRTTSSGKPSSARPPLPPSLPFWERLSIDRSQDYVDFKKKKDNLEMDECTFEPKTNENSGNGLAKWKRAKPMAIKKGAASAKKKR